LASKSFNNSWRYLVLKSISKAYPNCSKIKKLSPFAIKKNINLKDDILDDNIHILKYLGRYLMRPAIAEYRITKFKIMKLDFGILMLLTKKKIVKRKRRGS